MCNTREIFLCFFCFCLPFIQGPHSDSYLDRSHLTLWSSPLLKTFFTLFDHQIKATSIPSCNLFSSFGSLCEIDLQLRLRTSVIYATRPRVPLHKKNNLIKEIGEGITILAFARMFKLWALRVQAHEKEVSMASFWSLRIGNLKATK